MTSPSKQDVAAVLLMTAATWFSIAVTYYYLAEYWQHQQDIINSRNI